MRAMRNRFASWAGLVAVMVVAIGCGPSPKPVTPTGGESGDSGGPVSTVGVDPTPESICARVWELKTGNCALVSGFDLTRDECVADFHRSFEERGPDARKANISLGRCLLDNESCDAASTCVDQLSQREEGFRECGTDGNAPVGMPAAEFARRKAATVTRYSQATSTKEDPIEVCGIWEQGGQVEWLLSLSCDDGSHPFSGIHQAHASRVGNVGAGGRCASIIDLYEVPCPEGTYPIYIDAYVCPMPD